MARRQERSEPSPKMPPSGRSRSTSRSSRRKTLDPSMLTSGRGQPVPQVSEVGCGCKTWNRIGLGIDVSSTSTSDSRKHPTSGDKTPPASKAGKLPKSVSGIFSRRTSKPASPVAATSPKFEEQWSSFREQHQQEMNEMKQMYSALQSMCQEIKTFTLQSQGSSPPSKYCEDDSESLKATPQKVMLPARANSVASEKKRPPREKDVPTPRRAKSAPRTRTNGYPVRDMSSSMRLQFLKTPWTDLTTSLFEEIVQVQKTFLRSFCQSLSKHREQSISVEDLQDNLRPKDVVSSLIARLLPHTSFAKPWHLKYALEACVNRLVLGDFGSESYGLSSDMSLLDKQGAPRMSSWDEYEMLALLSPTDAINPDSRVYHENFHMFCNRKFQAIHDELQWWEEWPQTLVEDFLEAMKHVWRAHKLAYSFDPPAAIYCVKTSTAFDPKYMETLDVLTMPQFDASVFSSKVGFMVTPGFLVNGQVIKSQVYLMPKIGLLCSPCK